MTAIFRHRLSMIGGYAGLRSVHGKSLTSTLAHRAGRNGSLLCVSLLIKALITMHRRLLRILLAPGLLVVLSGATKNVFSTFVP
jgi:hypothetical protein